MSTIKFGTWQDLSGNDIITAASGDATFDGVTLNRDVPRVLVSDSDGQSLTGSSYNTIGFNEEAYDTHGMHDTSTNNSRLTAPSGWGGYYWVYAVGVCTAVANYASIFRSGGGSPIIYGIGGSQSDRFGVYGLVLLNAGDYVELGIYSVSGGSVYGGISLGGYSPAFGAVWMAPA